MLLAMPLVALALLAAGAALYVSRRRSRDARPSVRTLAWLVVPVAALVGAAAWCALGLYVGGPTDRGILGASPLVAGGAALLRGRPTLWVDRLADRSPEAGPPVRALLALVAILACVVLGFLAMELPYNPQALSIALNYAAIQMGLILGALLVLFFLFQRHGAGLVLGVGACWAIGLAQFFVARFKASAILPNDLFVLQTAAAVSSSYVYSVDGAVLLRDARLRRELARRGGARRVLQLAREAHARQPLLCARCPHGPLGGRHPAQLLRRPGRGNGVLVLHGLLQAPGLPHDLRGRGPGPPH